MDEASANVIGSGMAQEKYSFKNNFLTALSEILFKYLFIYFLKISSFCNRDKCVKNWNGKSFLTSFEIWEDN